MSNFSNSNPTLTNCIIWNNKDNSGIGTANASIANFSSSSFTATYSLIQGHTTSGDGNNNLDGSIDPLFVTPTDPNNAPTTGGNLRLTPCSPVINQGINDPFAAGGIAENVSTDLEGNPRIINTTVDLGAYEFQGDTEKPVIATLNDIADAKTSDGGTGDCMAQVAWTHPVVMDYSIGNCSNTVFTYQIGSETPVAITSYDGTTMAMADFPVGETTITYQATDDAGNMAEEMSFKITVTDDEDPTFTAPANRDEALDANCEITIPDLISNLTATDNCTTPTVTQSPLANAKVAVAHNGTTMVTITADDGNGNTTEKMVTITAKDGVDPTFTAPANRDAALDANCEITIPDLISNLTATDNCTTPTVTQSPLANAKVAVAHNGTTMVTITADDGNGNTTEKMVTITAKDGVDPILACQNINITLDPDGNYTLSNSDLNNLITNKNDNCTPANQLITSTFQQSFDCSHLGTNPLSISVQDIAGNTSAACTPSINVLAPISQMSISAATTSISETDAGTSVEITISRTNAACLASVNYSTLDGTATVSNNDYQPQAGTLNFAVGELSKTITIQINGDVDNENDETFSVAISGATNNNTITTNAVSITILNDDSPYTSLHFDGSNDHISIDNLMLSPSFTMETWVKYAGQQQQAEAIITYEGNALFFGFDDGQLRVFGTDVKDPNPFPINIWTHVAFSYHSGNNKVSLFINGQLIVSRTEVTFGPFANNFTGSLGLGAGLAGMQGSMDEFRIWDSPLTGADLSDKSNCQLAGDEVGLVLYFDFNDAIPNGDNTALTSIQDRSNNQYNSTLTNFDLIGTQSNFLKGGPVVNGICGAPLATAWRYFSAQNIDNQKVNLTWQVEQEVATSHYEIQRSADGKHFSPIGKVHANGQLNYQFLDDRPLRGDNYYRLREIENSGRFSFSETKLVRLIKENTISLFPNPTTGLVQIASEEKVQKVSVFDALGRVVLIKKAQYQIDLSQQATGIYFIEVQTANGSKIQRIMKE